MVTQTVQLVSADQGEESARADLYGLLAELFYAPPGADRLARLAAAAGADDSVLGRSWGALAQAARLGTVSGVHDEYEHLFIATGKPEVLLYGSYYLSGFLMEKPLAALRDDLRGLGLERAEQMGESEDHIAALCEVMRYLIACDDLALANLRMQKRFFGRHMQSWILQLCDAILNHPHANFYAAVAQFGKTFFEVEMQAFEME